MNPDFIISYRWEQWFLTFFASGFLWDLPCSHELQLEKEMAAHSSILAWKIPWTEDPVGYSPWSRLSDFTSLHHMSYNSVARHSIGGRVIVFQSEYFLWQITCRGKKKISLYPSRFLAETPYNKSQINRRTPKILIPYIPPLCTGETHKN